MAELSLEEQESLRTIVEAFYSKSQAATWEMNEAMLNVVTHIIRESRSCSNAFDFVPRPGVYLNPEDVRKELKRMAKRVLRGGGLNYMYCTEVAGLKAKNAAAIAGNGAAN